MRCERFIKSFNPSTHITKKIWFSTASVALAILLFLAALVQVFLGNYYAGTMLSRAKTNHEYTVNAFEDTFTHIIDRFVELCGTEDFKALLSRIRSAEKSDYAELNNELQTTLHNLTASSSLLSSAVITSRSGLIYRSASVSLKDSGYGYTLGYPEDDICGITLLPQMSSPIRAQNDVVPIAIPLAVWQDKYVLVCDNAAESDAILFLLLNALDFSNFLNAYSDDETTGSLYLVSGNGQTIISISNLTEEQSEEEASLLPELAEKISGGTYSGTVYVSGSYMIYEQIDNRNLYLVNILPKSLLTKSADALKWYIICFAAASIILITLITRFAASYITKPLNKLAASIRSIEDGSYRSGQTLPQKDELGQMSRAIDSMYHTIQEQLEEIKNERQTRFNTEIRLYSEQINPHFLYNTLEYINMEVYNHHADIAGLMIQSLGDYLRIGLNFGSQLIEIPKEIRHVQAYLNIMNHRFDYGIAFTCEVDEELKEYHILKIILQPLVENSIRHGFLLEKNSAFIAAPAITISVRRQEEAWILISVTDNGIGIDVEKAKKSMLADPNKQHHIGLSNVYQRLKVFYNDEADIRFQSIPYYKNTVQIWIPYKTQAAEAES